MTDRLSARFVAGLERLGLSEDEVSNHWKYCGKEDPLTLRGSIGSPASTCVYFAQSFPDAATRPQPLRAAHCICGTPILINTYITPKQPSTPLRVLVIGSCCRLQFINGAAGKTCGTCGACHLNRLDNFCKGCREIARLAAKELAATAARAEERERRVAKELAARAEERERRAAKELAATAARAAAAAAQSQRLAAARDPQARFCRDCNAPSRSYLYCKVCAARRYPPGAVALPQQACEKCGKPSKQYRTCWGCKA